MKHSVKFTKKDLKIYGEKFDTMTLSGRVIYALIILSLGYLFVNFVSFIFLPEGKSSLKETKIELIETVNNLKNSMEKSKASYDDKLKKLKEYSETKKLFEKSLKHLSGKYLSNHSLDEILTGILKFESGLNLVKIENRKEEELQRFEDKNKLFKIVELGSTLTMKGDFFSTIEYTKQIGSLEWPVFWSKFHYVVEKYPIADIEISISVLNKREVQ